MTGPSRPATASCPRPAATVVLLRDGRQGPEVYLLRRVAAMAFAAGMYVFPGGSVDPADEADDVGWVGPAPATWAGPLSASVPQARALVCAAVRETFEESGVLLAGPTAGELADVSGADWEDERVALEARRISLSELLRRRGLLLRADLLRAWSHWITPEVEPKRFDTRFFLAALPEGQQTRLVGGEADRVTWVPLAEVADRLERRDMVMLPPTATTLAELRGYATVAAALAASAARVIRPILPKIVSGPDEPVRVLLPGQPGYDVEPALRAPRSPS